MAAAALAEADVQIEAKAAGACSVAFDLAEAAEAVEAAEAAEAAEAVEAVAAERLSPQAADSEAEMTLKGQRRPV